MKEVYYVYNNEAIGSCVLLSIFNKAGNMDIARCCLALPLLLDDKTVSYLNKNFSTIRNLEIIIKEQPRLFTSFNKRFLSLLPVTVNSIMILTKGNQVSINGQVMSKNNLDPINFELGERFGRIREAIPHFLALIENYTTEQLYKLFKVQL